MRLVKDDGSKDHSVRLVTRLTKTLLQFNCHRKGDPYDPNIETKVSLFQIWQSKGAHKGEKMSIVVVGNVFKTVFIQFLILS